MSRYSVVIVDDHPPFREGLRMILQRTGEFHVVIGAGSVAEGCTAINREKPDFAVIDIALPDGDGMELVRMVRRDSPDTRILVLTMYTQHELAEAAFRAGAHGYVLKESSSRELAKALRAIRVGAKVIDPRLVLQKNAHIDSSQTMAPTAGSIYGYSLSNRELEVFRLIAAGRSSKEIGAELGISRKTADNHRGNILRKTDCATVVDLVRLAIRTGIAQV